MSFVPCCNCSEIYDLVPTDIILIVLTASIDLIVYNYNTSVLYVLGYRLLAFIDAFSVEKKKKKRGKRKRKKKRAKRNRKKKNTGFCIIYRTFAVSPACRSVFSASNIPFAVPHPRTAPRPARPSSIPRTSYASSTYGKWYAKQGISYTADAHNRLCTCRCVHGKQTVDEEPIPR